MYEYAPTWDRVFSGLLSGAQEVFVPTLIFMTYLLLPTAIMALLPKKAKSSVARVGIGYIDWAIGFLAVWFVGVIVAVPLALVFMREAFPIMWYVSTYLVFMLPGFLIIPLLFAVMFHTGDLIYNRPLGAIKSGWRRVAEVGGAVGWILVAFLFTRTASDTFSLDAYDAWVYVIFSGFVFLPEITRFAHKQLQ